MRLLFLPIAAVALSSSLFSQDSGEKVTYEDHVKPIFRQHCFSCHNQNEKKGGLALDTFASTIEGGSSGEIVFDGEASSSRLWMLMAHEDTPVMPPGQDKLPDELIATVKKWIDLGLLENSGSTAKKKKASKLAFSASADGRPEGPVAMPETVWQQPVIVTERVAAVTSIQSSPWAPLVAIGGQRQIVLYNTENGECVGILPFPEGEPHSLTFSRDGSYLLVGGGHHSQQGLAVLYDIRSGDPVARCGDELDIVLGSDINPTLSRVALGGPQRLVRIHDVDSGEKVFELKKHTDWVYSVRFSPDGVLVASGDRAGGLVLWEADTGRLYLDLVGHKDAIRGIAWRSDSNVVASASLDGTVKLWEVFNGGQIKNFSAHGGGVTGIDMARDGKIVTCGRDRVVKLWDADGNLIREFPAFPEAVMKVVFNHDGTRVIAGDWSGLIKMWKTDDPAQELVLSANPAPLEIRMQQATELASTTAAAFQTQSAAYTAAEGKLSGTVAMVQSLGEQVAAAKAAADAAEQQRIAAVAAMDKAQAERDAKAQQHDQGVAAAATALKSAADLGAARDAGFAELKGAEGARDAAIAARDTHAATLQKIDEQLAQVQGTDEAATQQRATLNAQRNEALTLHTQQAQALQLALQQVDAAHAKAKAAVDGLQAAIPVAAAAQNALGQLQTEFAAARAALLAATTAASMAAAEAEKTKVALATLEKQLLDAQQQIPPQTTERDQAQQSLSAATAARDSAAAKLSRLQQSWNDFQAAGASLVATENSLSEQLSALTAQMQTAEQGVNEVMSKMASTDQQMADMAAQLEAIKAQLEQLRASKEQLEQQRQATSAQVEQIEAEKSKAAQRRALFEAAYSKTGS